MILDIILYTNLSTDLDPFPHSLDQYKCLFDLCTKGVVNASHACLCRSLVVLLENHGGVACYRTLLHLRSPLYSQGAKTDIKTLSDTFCYKHTTYPVLMFNP